jgi:hypothetical protein
LQLPARQRVLLYGKSSPLSKCLTKNNMASMVRPRAGARFHRGDNVFEA